MPGINMEKGLRLRLIGPGDVEFIVTMKSTPVFWPYETDIDGDREKVRQIVLARMAGDWYRQYVILLDGASIGACHVHELDKARQTWEIGYGLLPAYRGHGYGAAAARGVLFHAFKELGARRVCAMCDARNVPSYRVMEKIGMTREGLFRQELPWKDGWADQLFYAILKGEFRGGGL